ncbi:chemotaxis protein MotB [Thermoclostridium caenicola]|uniref:Chemotaxis protein MotB n=1 Tax=Thermoclostridium caenicola TaxID=659425 RepID=A0A1M6BLE1_9FIRM|nr:chemotaxis protein MotB [Thermoclostridium caenicola]
MGWCTRCPGILIIERNGVKIYLPKRKQRTQDSWGAPEWMTTYSDMVTLLLTFFILLFAMSTVDAQKFTDVAKSLSTSFMNLSTGESILNSTGKSLLTVDFANPSNLNRPEQKERYVESAEEMIVDAERQIYEMEMDIAKEGLRQAVEEQGIADQVEIIEEKDFILVRFESEVFFDSGRADIRPEGLVVLQQLAEVLRNIDNEILVSGHTDNVPINTPIFKSNWELSTARATTVVRYFTETLGLDPMKFTATGNGEYRPVADNSTPEGRQRNRRIEIMIMK